MAAADMPALRTNSRIADDKAMGLRSGAPSDSSNATTPRKRQRTTSLSEEGTKSNLFSGIGAQLAKDPDIWLPDGNLVLEADGIAFKVYGGLLAAQSEVFRELLSDAAQDRRMLELNPFAEICPTIRLTDHPDDLRHLLRVVFFSSSLLNSANGAMPFPVVAALVQLGYKYRIQPVVDEGIRRMSSCFSGNLDIWDEANTNMGNTLMSYASTDAIAVVNIARLTGVHSMLPVALYICCQLDIDTIINGVLCENGSRAQLAPDDIALCLEQRMCLCHDNVISALRIWRPTPSEDCKMRADRTCVGVLEAVTNDWLNYDTSGLNHAAVMDTWNEFFENGEFDLCEPCLEMVKRRATEERKTLWERLPQLFGVVVPDSTTATIKRDY
ncbi:hypothetical protein C8Q72DRAFT_198512 [Fomitopsis betulina]|nr:hypothetical protein C8Q72DRAFT_198512 [Fomitopsis betulina]